MKKVIITLTMLTSMMSFSQELKVSPKLETGILQNGLTYYIYPNAKPDDKASIHLVVDSGSLEETEEQLGVAHFLEHMAFNGTEKFPQNDLVKYFQSVGMKFGGDLNAHTGFTETVYKLNVPTNNEDYEKAFEVMKEWATNITFDPNETEKEKNVVLEEWRSRQGLRARTMEAQKKAVYGESRYSERMPIGDPEIIKSLGPDLVEGYYDKWYIPKNMSLIVVGDMDIEETIGYIEEYFDYPDDRQVPKKPAKILGRGNGEIYTFTDPEITSSTIDIIIKEDRGAITTEKEYRDYIVRTLYTGILQERFQIITKKANSPVRDGYNYEFNLNGRNSIRVIGGILDETKINDGIELVYENTKVLAEYLPSVNELKREKLRLETSFELINANRDSMENDSFISDIKNYHQTGELFLEVDEQYKLFEKIISQIGVEDINEYAKEVYENKNVSYFMIAPDKKGIELPSEKEINSIITNIRDGEVEEYIDNIGDLELKTSIPNTGKILEKKTEKFNERYLLNNNVEVLVKKTDFDKDKISIKFFQEGGDSMLDYDGFVSTKLAKAITNSGLGNLGANELEIFLKNKNIEFEPFIKDYEHGIDIVTTKKDLETALQMAYLINKDGKIDEDVFINEKSQLIQEIKNRKNSPNLVYADNVKSKLYDKNPRKLPIKVEDIEELTSKKVLDSFKEIFGNSNGRRVVINGSLDGVDIESLIKKYIATLPSETEKTEKVTLVTKELEGETTKTIVKGIDKKGIVTVVYPYKGEYSYDNRVDLLAASNILTNMLIEKVREEIGGVYSIGSRAMLRPISDSGNYIYIRFTTDTKRVDEVTEAVKGCVEELLKGNYPERILDSITQNYRFNYDNMLESNEFWNGFLYRRELYQDGFKIIDPDEYDKMITRENITNFLEGKISSENYVDVRLIPESE